MTGGKFQPRITPLKKPLVRRTGNLVVKLAPEGIHLRGHRKRAWKFIPWQLVAAMVDLNGLLAATEAEYGGKVLDRLTTGKKGKNGTAAK